MLHVAAALMLLCLIPGAAVFLAFRPGKTSAVIGWTVGLVAIAVTVLAWLSWPYEVPSGNCHNYTFPGSVGLVDYCGLGHQATWVPATVNVVVGLSLLIGGAWVGRRRTRSALVA